MYHYGLGMAKNLKVARDYYNKAVATGTPGAKISRGNLNSMLPLGELLLKKIQDEWIRIKT
jgi:TPR repeat protein